MREYFTETYFKWGRPEVGGRYAADARMQRFGDEAADALVRRYREEYDELFEKAAAHFWEMNCLPDSEGPRGPHGLPHIKSDQDGGDPSEEARPHDQNDDPSEQPQEP